MTPSDRGPHPHHPLTGEDGRVSWSKLVLAAVLTLYGFQRPLPTTVAIVCILASFGSRVLLKGLGLMEVRLGAIDQLTRVAQTSRIDVTKRVDVAVRQILEKRDPETGEPMPGAPGQEVDP